MDEYLTTRQAANELDHKTTSAIVEWIRRGHLHAIKFGRYWAIPRTEWERFKAAPRPTGRPKKSAEN